MRHRAHRFLVRGLAAAFVVCGVLRPLTAKADGEIQVEGGAMRDYRAPRNGFFYRVDYQGVKLSDYGKAFEATPNPNASMARLMVAAGDSADISIRFERGNLTTSGDVFTATGIKPIGMMLPALRRLRGTAQASGSLDGKSTTFALGVETPPFHAPEVFGLTRESISHWLVLGIQSERRRRDSKATELVEASAIQARWFIGRSLGRRGHSAHQRQALQEAITSLRSRVRTYREADALDQEWRTRHKGEQRPPMEGAVGAIVGGLVDQVDAMSPEQRTRILDDANWWGSKVFIWASEETLPADQPRATLRLDGYVRREFGADRISDAALQLLRAQLQIWLSLENPDQGWVTLAYVNGFDRADPGVRREQIVMSFGVSF